MIFNVRVAVVELVEAATEKEAIRLTRERLRQHGFEWYEDDADAFESEDQDPDQPLDHPAKPKVGTSPLRCGACSALVAYNGAGAWAHMDDE